MSQKIITAQNDYAELDAWLADAGKTLLVCDDAIDFQAELTAHLRALQDRGAQLAAFREFQPNPLYESVVKGLRRFRSEGCQAIMAVGGGSAIDVAKCIKLYSNMAGDGAMGSFLKQEIVPNHIPFLAMPTTAGTGSEATRYAVIYYEGKKQSVTHASCIPQTVLLDPNSLKTLPPYQRKATMMDALCHAIESCWSINSTPESMNYSRRAIAMVMANREGYLNNTEAGNRGMLQAAHTAGKAINITQTTAGHAMCYKITSLFRVAHGHAAILCDRVLLPWMIQHTDRCIDPRGEGHLVGVFREIARAMGCETPEDAAAKLNDIFDALALAVPQATEEQLAELSTSVNPVRLKNHPIALDAATIRTLYRAILRPKCQE